MTLAEFIRAEMETILAEWERFAKSIPSATGMDSRSLRDDAKNILLAIALDMESAQTGLEQFEKSMGRKAPISDQDSEATIHGSDRFLEGFSLKEMVSEYRALRASVIRLWLMQPEAANIDRIYELTRFNEGIDQALTESIGRFSDQLDNSRELFMGVLSHDLRTPLQIILQSTHMIAKASLPQPLQQSTQHIERSARNIKRLVDDLLDVTRTRLGAAMPLDPQMVDAAVLSRRLVEDLLALHPKRDIQLETRGDLNGMWDSGRLNQLLTNLARNAVQYGDVSAPVTIRAIGEADHVVFEVHNFGEPISPAILPRIFDPLVRANVDSAARTQTANMGLGLYIASTIAKAHAGTLTAESSREKGTLFRARLPRRSGVTHVVQQD
jgi:signal transduction histidine kinase